MTFQGLASAGRRDRTGGRRSSFVLRFPTTEYVADYDTSRSIGQGRLRLMSAVYDIVSNSLPVDVVVKKV